MSSRTTLETLSLCIKKFSLERSIKQQPSRSLTMFAYWPKDPNATPFPPRQVIFRATIFDEFYGTLHQPGLEIGGRWLSYAFDGQAVIPTSHIPIQKGDGITAISVDSCSKLDQCSTTTLFIDITRHRYSGRYCAASA